MLPVPTGFHIDRQLADQAHDNIVEHDSVVAIDRDNLVHVTADRGRLDPSNDDAESLIEFFAHEVGLDDMASYGITQADRRQAVAEGCAQVLDTIQVVPLLTD